MEPFDEYELRGYRVTIWQDTDTESPRDYCQNGLIAVSDRAQHSRSNYTNPDGVTLPDDLECPTCHGAEYPDNEADVCQTCLGGGETEATFAMLVEWAKREHGATTVIGLSGPHDWGGRWNARSYHDDDTRVDGLIFDTAAKRAETGSDAENMRQYLESELDEYNAWADGECYGFTITDCNGDEVESCGGNIGEQWVREAAAEEVPMVSPERRYSIRLTAHQWELIVEALADSPEGHTTGLAAAIGQQIAVHAASVR